MSERGRVLAVSNRLPVTITYDNVNKRYSYVKSSGGLVSALSSLSGLLWLGWSGIPVPDESRDTVTEALNQEFDCHPVFLNEELAELYYNGFSNSILWPLFHYHPGEMNFDDESWEAYTLANRVFAKAVADVYKPGDLIWVHDYHLMLLPAMIREELQAAGHNPRRIEIAFFLHTPFPTSEIYRILPVRQEILLGVLQSDLIGFHTYDYVRHFLSSVNSVLQLEISPVGVTFDRPVSVGVFPLGTDPKRFSEGLKVPSVIERIKQLRKIFSGYKVCLGIDRLDYIKGLPHKFNAFNIFLTEHPEWIGKVILIQVAVPSRQDVEDYQNLRAVVNELVGRINGKYGTAEFQPIHYLHKSIDFHELIALYALSDVCVVSSTRDGMNLVAYEYIACQLQKHGQLILSEFTGAAQSLNGSIIVNPWDMEEMSEAFMKALTMPDDKREENHSLLLKYVNKFTTTFWASNIVKEMKRIANDRDNSDKSFKPEVRSKDILETPQYNS